MLQTVKELILDAQDNQQLRGTPRLLEISPLKHKATIIIGVRRCGKTTFLNQVIDHLKNSGTQKENILYINFFDDRLSNIKEAGLDKVLDAYYLLYPEKKNEEKIYCFFDEIQVIPGWEKFVDRILRNENCEVYISGSSANLLSKEIATQMRGRALSWELFPFSFKEFLHFQNINSIPPYNTQNRLSIQNAFELYWDNGGFPEVFTIDRQLRAKIHQEYFNSILFHDLIDRYDISHPRALHDLAKRLVDNVASLYTLNGLTNFLKSRGHKVPKSTVADYLAWFEDAYFLFTVRIFNASYSKSNANPKKIYCIDHSLVKSVSSGILLNLGHLLENLVFISLRRRYTDIFYYKTKGNLEIDFLVQTNKRERLLIQVTESLANPGTRHREINALQHAMLELELPLGTIITREEENEIKFDNKLIRVVPVWKFLLEKL